MNDSVINSISPSPTAENTDAPSALPGFFSGVAQLDREFIVYDDGWRGWSYPYRDVAQMAANVAERLVAQGLRKGDRVMICSESRPGYVAALWGCFLGGFVAVPVEVQSSPALLSRIEAQIKASALLIGERNLSVPISPGVLVWRFSDIETDQTTSSISPRVIGKSDSAEIIFTSGTTAEPKGVVMTHRNLAACIEPLEAQLAPYRRYFRLLAPLRVLNLLPMSHLFGQVVTLFVVPMLPGSVVLMDNTNPEEIAAQICRRKICTLVAVPRVLDVLRTYLLHRFPETSQAGKTAEAWYRRWWRYRAVHRLFGWRFCCLVVGGAALPPELEQFWSGLGFVVAQGYGLTETAPIISFNHPFHAQHGTVGKPIAGLDIKLAADGEVLVRGDNVTPGYYQLPTETAAAFQDGWLRTGDLGQFDANGDLIIRGRKKDIIVSPDGLKVFPDDVERALNKIAGVRESAVVDKGGVHAVLVLAPGAIGEEIVREANEQLEPQQRIRSFSLWPGDELPRTTSTQNLRRAEILQTIRTGQAPAEKTVSTVTSLLQRFAPGRLITSDTTLEQLGLSSLDRVELMLELQEKLNISLDDSALSSSSKVSDLSQPSELVKPIPEPTYNRRWFARALRRTLLPTFFLPLTRFFARSTVSGLSNLDAIKGPVIFASNHQSYIDPAVILSGLPANWRYRIAPAMWMEYFDAHFSPDRYPFFKRLGNTILYRLVTLLFNAFPLSQMETGTRHSFRYIGELVEEGWSILIFPEGERTMTGEIGRFYPGVAMIASRMRLPIIPIHLIGVDAVWHRHSSKLRPGPVEIRIGPPIYLEGGDYEDMANQVKEAVRRL